MMPKSQGQGKGVDETEKLRARANVFFKTWNCGL